jgi:LDH2 family malate/lactate/ureidoglycolate dehydrogenase
VTIAVKLAEETIAMGRYRSDGLIDFAAAVLAGAGLEAPKTRTVAEILVEGDLIGHDTHGLQLLPAYVRQLREGTMTASGEHEVVSDRAAVAVWDGRYLPGAWLTVQALEAASGRATRYGVGAVAIRRSHHIACLAAYLPRITSRNQVGMIACADPAVATVAPFGGLDAVFTPDPIAFGFPTDGDPVVIDMSASITTNGMAGRLAARGERFREKWLQDSDGTATNDPKVLSQEPPGTILPTGGKDHGHKGYGLALIVESLSLGLAGFGRVDGPRQWGASVYVQVFDPELFSGAGAFGRQTGHLAALCRQSRVPDGAQPVRLPGEQALKTKRLRLREGIELDEDRVKSLGDLAVEYGLAPPTAI